MVETRRDPSNKSDNMFNLRKQEKKILANSTNTAAQLRSPQIIWGTDIKKDKIQYWSFLQMQKAPRESVRPNYIIECSGNTTALQRS